METAAVLSVSANNLYFGMGAHSIGVHLPTSQAKVLKLLVLLAVDGSVEVPTPTGFLTVSVSAGEADDVAMLGVSLNGDDYVWSVDYGRADLSSMMNVLGAGLL